jgi:hypothetical protein
MAKNEVGFGVKPQLNQAFQNNNILYKSLACALESFKMNGAYNK